MSNLVPLDEYGITERNGKPVVSSRYVAEIFGKRHDNVMADVKNLDCSSDFSLLNFEESNYKLRGKKYPEYLMTKDGFIFLAMGYRGKKAAAFKEAYINRFNQMEQFISELQESKFDFPAFTNAVMLAHPEPKNHHYSNETDMINRIVLGMTAKKYKEVNGLDPKVGSIRRYLNSEQIRAIVDLQRADIGLLVSTPDFQERKQFLTEYFSKRGYKQLTS